MRNREIAIRKEFVTDIRTIIGRARESAIRSVDFQRVLMYWHLGQRIFEEEQHGKKRAGYGENLVRNLAKEIEPEYGSGFSYRQLYFCLQFYQTFPIVNALRSQLNWSQYRLLLRIGNPDKREYYLLETVNNSWTGRELERQINSGLYERLLLSNDKEAVFTPGLRGIPGIPGTGYRLFFQAYSDRNPEIRHTAGDESKVREKHHMPRDVLEDVCSAYGHGYQMDRRNAV